MKDEFENPFSKLTRDREFLTGMASKYSSAYSSRECYNGDIVWIFSKIRESVLFMVSDLRSTTHFGADFKTINTEDLLEAWIIEHLFPRLEQNEWPAPGTAGFVECMHRLKVDIMNADPAIIELRKSIRN